MLGVENDVAGMHFAVTDGTLRIRLRSGRGLVYPRIRRQDATFETYSFVDRDGVRQTAVDDRPKILYGNGFELYGGLIVENIVQATSRDLLADVLYRLEAAGLQVVHHCHDSVTVAVPLADEKIAEAVLLATWRAVPDWARGLVLDAEAKSGTTLEDA
jgi:DNA polymerase